MIKYVYFDLGLTLVHNDMPQVYKEAIEKCGYLISLKDAEIAYHLTNKYFMRYRQGELGKGNVLVFHEYVRKYCEYLHIDDSEMVIKELSDRKKKTSWHAYAYTRETLDILKNMGIKMGLISNWDLNCRNVLDENVLTPYLSNIFVSSEQKMEKPDVRLFEKAIDACGFQKNEILYVGDNYYDDYLGAHKANIDCVILNYKDHLGIEEIKDITIFETIKEVPNYIKGELK